MAPSRSNPRPPVAQGTMVGAIRQPLRDRGEKMARAFDENIHPLYGQRLEQMVLRDLIPIAGAQVLHLGAGSGTLTTELLRRFDQESRFISLEALPPLQNLARERLGQDHPGRRVFFRTHEPTTALPFGNDHFEVVIATIDLDELIDPEATLKDLVRVLKPGGTFVLATPVRGTWGEIIDLMREALVQHWDVPALAALEQYEKKLFEAPALLKHLNKLGIKNCGARVDRWELLFRTAREFFFAPIIELGPLRRWKNIAGTATVVQDVFNDVRIAIETYFHGRTFPVSVVGGCFSGTKFDPKSSESAAVSKPEAIRRDKTKPPSPRKT